MSTGFLVPNRVKAWLLLISLPLLLNPNILNSVSGWLTSLMLSEVLPERIYHVCFHCCPTGNICGIGAWALPSCGHPVHSCGSHTDLFPHLVVQINITETYLERVLSFPAVLWKMGLLIEHNRAKQAACCRTIGSPIFGIIFFKYKSNNSWKKTCLNYS